MTIDDVPMLIRREIEARIIAPFVQDLAARFGREAVIEVLRGTIERIAREQGGRAAQACGEGTEGLERLTEKWKEGGALELTVLQRDAGHFDFDVTRCGYAEMYRRLGIPELGRILSCGRDFAVADGFSPDLELHRTQTILEGAPCCDFRFRVREGGQESEK